MLATCLNAATLALVDTGVPMTGYVVGCTVGLVGVGGGGGDAAEPVLDVNALEEQELPFLTLATGGGVNLSSDSNLDSNASQDQDQDEGEGKEGAGGAGAVAGIMSGRAGRKKGGKANASVNAKIALLVLETRVPADRLEDMLAVGMEGCERVRRILDAVVRAS